MAGSPTISSKGEAVKRKRDHDGAISPPPLKRKVASGTTQTAVASFFTPASQKPPEKVTWIERGAGKAGPKTLLVGRYVPAKKGEIETLKEESKRRKVAAFDFVSCDTSEFYVESLALTCVFSGFYAGGDTFRKEVCE